MKDAVAIVSATTDTKNPGQRQSIQYCHTSPRETKSSSTGFCLLVYRPELRFVTKLKLPLTCNIIL